MALKAALIGLALTACAEPSMVETINIAVNESMAYQAEAPGHDFWATDCPKRGDCEDYALCKARKLIELGYSTNRLTVLLGENQRSGVHHAVLQVDQREILDNIADDVFRPIYACGMDGRIWIFAAGQKIELSKRQMEKFTKCRDAVASMR